MAEKKNVKWFSRKFIVWIAWFIFAFASLFFERVPAERVFEYFGIISMFYLGANAVGDFSPVAKKYMQADKKTAPDTSEKGTEDI